MKAEYCKPWHNVGQEPYAECEIHPENIDGCDCQKVYFRNKKEFLISINNQQYLVSEENFVEFEKYFDIKIVGVGAIILAKSDKVISNYIDLFRNDEHFVYILKDKQILSVKCLK